MPCLWKEIAEQELLAARKAQNANMNGRARVSARRAAGYAVREYYSHHGILPVSKNYYQLLMLFSEDPAIPKEMRSISSHLCQRVDEKFSLPDDFDLIEEAGALVQYITDCTN